ncbi:hypothetical protein Btru_050137 [Bulinus truncatus]|nr:hypothetical protein Btru_050137 [Bulinus truncatus]
MQERDNPGVLAFFSFMMAVVAFFAAVSNGVVFLAMVKALIRDISNGRHQKINTSTNSLITRLLMCSMTVSGIAASVFLMPLSLLEFIDHRRLIYGYLLCSLNIYADYSLCLVLNMHVSFMAVDTYMQICKPLFYRELTARSGFYFVSIGWTVPIAIMITWSSLQEEKLDNCSTSVHSFSNIDVSTVICFIFGIMFLLTLLMIWLTYFFVLRAIINLQKRFMANKNKYFKTSVNNSKNNTQLDYSSDISTESNVTSAGVNTSSKHIDTVSKYKFRLNVKYFRVVGLILICYTVGWLPVWVVYLIYFTVGLSLPAWAGKFLAWVVYFSCAVNPVVYCSNKNVLCAVQQFICKR